MKMEGLMVAREWGGETDIHIFIISVIIDMVFIRGCCTMSHALIYTIWMFICPETQRNQSPNQSKHCSGLVLTLNTLFTACYVSWWVGGRVLICVYGSCIRELPPINRNINSRQPLILFYSLQCDPHQSSPRQQD